MSKGAPCDVQLPVTGYTLSIKNLPHVKKMTLTTSSRPSDIFGDFKKGYSGFGVNNGSFSFGDVIEYILEYIGPSHALISSWVVSSASIRNVLRYLGNKKFLSIRFLLDRMLPNTRPEIYDYILRNFGSDSIRTSRVHMKFCALYNDEWSVVIETSANLNKNTRLESFRVTESAPFCEFFKELFDNLFVKFKSIGNVNGVRIFSEVNPESLLNVSGASKPSSFEMIKNSKKPWE